MFSQEGTKSDFFTPRHIQSAATGLTGLSRPGTNFSLQRPKTGINTSKAATVKILKQNLGMNSSTKAVENFGDWFDMPNVPFYEPEQTERETPFFKSLTAEYMSTI